MANADKTTIHPQRRKTNSGLRSRLVSVFDRVPGFRFRFTVDGVAAILITSIVGFAAWHAGANLLYLLFSAQISLFIMHGALIWQNMSKLRIVRLAPAIAQAQKPVRISFDITNDKKWLSTRGLRITDKLFTGGITGSSYVLEIGPGESKRCQYDTTFPRRGLYELGMVEVVTRYPFGFNERGFAQLNRANIIVLPSTWPIASQSLSLSSEYGEAESSEKGSGVELYGIREYVYGENVRRIHWKTTAKAGELMVLETEKDEVWQATLLFDNAKPEETSDSIFEDFENAVSLTASIARQLIDEGYEVSFRCRGESLTAASGQEQLQLILKVLAVIDLSKGRFQGEALPGSKELYVHFGNLPPNFKNGQRRKIDSRHWKIENRRFVKVEP